MLLDGRELAGYIKERHAKEVRSLRHALRRAPSLVIISAGEDLASRTYMRVKARYGEDIGVSVAVQNVPPEHLRPMIESANANPLVDGIILQLPLPNRDDEAGLLGSISPDKDVDGLVPESPFEAATPKAILWLLAGYGVELSGRRVAVVGQGRLVGKPLADRLEEMGVQTVRLDEHSDLEAGLREADVVVAATGVPGLITPELIRPDAVLVDAGAGRRDGKPAGDLAPELYAEPNRKVTPNPGGVGPVTVAALFDNVLICARSKAQGK